MRSSDAIRDEQFRTFVAAHRGSLLRTATLLCLGNSHQAEDLVQTVLLRMYLSWHKIRPETRQAYARKALVNAHLDEKRRPHWRRERSHAEVPDFQADDRQADTDASTDTEVFRALAELPPRMRAAVVLRFLHDASVAETADALGCSEGNVKSQTARGLARMRSALALAIDTTSTAVRGTNHE
jgi:RNA polymerase sigma-70 factor (sigma-E family)